MDFKVNLNRVSQIKRFVQAAMSMECDIDIISGRFVIDAKSIMGLFALDLSNDVYVHLHTKDPDVVRTFKDKIAECVVD